MGLFDFFKKNKAAAQETEDTAFTPNSLSHVKSIYPDTQSGIDTTIKKPAPAATYLDTDITDADLEVLIHQSIAVFENNPGADHHKIIGGIKIYSNDEQLANAMYRFIPTAYCRLFYPEPQYSDEYITYASADKQDTYLFSKDRIYNAVLAASKEILMQTTSGDKMMAVVQHSAEFDAINNALNGGSDIKDLVLSPAVFMEA